jgi:transposase
MGSRVELFATLRRDARVEGLSVRELARRHGVHRRTVRQALKAADPPPRKPRVSPAPRLDPFKATIDEMLRQDLDAPRKQRHTARRILARLAEEHGATDLSCSTVRDYVDRHRPMIDAEAGRGREVFVPQEYAPGAEAEVDFGELWVVLAGVKTKCHMFAFRLSFSGKAIHRVYPTQAQEAFLEGHIDAFEDIGGIPTRHIRYDNLTDAVAKVIYGTRRQRTENPRWVLFRSHYGSMRSIAGRGLRALTRRVVSKARSAGSGAPIYRRCPLSIPSRNSTTESDCGTLTMKTGGSMTGSAPSRRTSPSSGRSWAR